MKSTVWLLVVFGCVNAVGAEHLAVYQHGTVVRMRTGDCLSLQRGFMVAMGGPPMQLSGDACPEYTLVSDKVVFVIVGRSSAQLIPLADVIDFRFHNRELMVRVDDAKHESKFGIKEMMLRSEWNAIQQHMVDQLNAMPGPANGTLITRSQN
jgi:hypothetical protein